MMAACIYRFHIFRFNLCSPSGHTDAKLTDCLHEEATVILLYIQSWTPQYEVPHLVSNASSKNLWTNLTFCLMKETGNSKKHVCCKKKVTYDEIRLPAA